MKRKIELFGIIAIVAIIGLVMLACDNGNTTAVDPCANGHAFPEWTEPTCEIAGNSTKTCTRSGCNETDIRATGFNALGHEGLDTIPATCTTVGYSGSGPCIRCQVNVTGEVIPINPNAHDWNWTLNAIEANCVSASKDTATCNNSPCAVTNERIGSNPIDPATHNWTSTTQINIRPGVNAKTCNNNCGELTEVELTLNIGNTGLGGGVIFYVAPTGFTMTDTNETCYYLEASINNTSIGVPWASAETPHISGTSTAIGTGRKNTTLILETDTNAPAALMCKNYNGGGLYDWFLPSRDELDRLYEQKNIFDNWGTEYTYLFFWSSSQDGGYAIARHFDTGSHTNGFKQNTFSVRAIRGF